ncbi:MAG: hypothetical protein GEU74_16095 [Nitriliruptorales bacterium]|nr:hypothetical protein [Nitriliruptorales bacterium]
MTARVNLLPPEIGERARARRTTSFTIGAVAGWIAVLGVLYIVQLGDLNAAREERDQARAEVARLQAEVDRLQEYAELDRLVTARDNVITVAMATEISWARVLNDLALTFPPSSSLLTFTAATPTAADAGAATPPPPGTDGGSVAAVSFEGYSVERYAPGVERVLIKFEEVDTFFDSYVTQASNEDRANTEVTRFSGTYDLTDDAYTGRYAEGLPPGVGQ